MANKIVGNPLPNSKIEIRSKTSSSSSTVVMEINSDGALIKDPVVASPNISVGLGSTNDTPTTVAFLANSGAQVIKFDTSDSSIKFGPRSATASYTGLSGTIAVGDILTSATGKVLVLVAPVAGTFTFLPISGSVSNSQALSNTATSASLTLSSAPTITDLTTAPTSGYAAPTVESKTTSFTAESGKVYRVKGTLTATLPNPASTPLPRIYITENSTDSDPAPAISLAPFSSETIHGVPSTTPFSAVITQKNFSLTLVSDGAKWYLMDIVPNPDLVAPKFERALFAGGYDYSPLIDYSTIATPGNSTSFDDLTLARGDLASSSSSHGGLQ